MKITEKLLSKGKNARSGLLLNRIKKIIIHWIGPYPNQSVHSPWNWWENGSDGKGIKASAHFILKDDEVLQSLPLNEVGWHSGDDRNYESIGIEVIPMNNEGEFSKASIETLRLLIAHIRKEVGNSLTLERHYDGVQKKDCPRFYTPLSEVLTKENQQDNATEKGEQRWEKLKSFLNGGGNDE